MLGFKEMEATTACVRSNQSSEYRPVVNPGNTLEQLEWLKLGMKVFIAGIEDAMTVANFLSRMVARSVNFSGRRRTTQTARTSAR